MWAKETTLLTFHMWRRYSAVRCAYRREEPVPRFSLPFLDKWPKLLQAVSLRYAHHRCHHHHNHHRHRRHYHHHRHYTLLTLILHSNTHYTLHH